MHEKQYMQTNEFDPAIAVKVSEAAGFPVTFGEEAAPTAENYTSYTETSVRCPLSGEGVVDLGRFYSEGHGDGRSTDDFNVNFNAGLGKLTIVGYDASHDEYDGQVQIFEQVFVDDILSTSGSRIISDEIDDDVNTSDILTYEINLEEAVSSITVSHVEGDDGTPNSLNACLQYTPVETPPVTTTTTTTTTTPPPTTTTPPPTTSTTTTTAPPPTTTEAPPETTTTTTTAAPPTTTTPETTTTTTTTTEAPPETTTSQAPPLLDASDTFANFEESATVDVAETQALVEAGAFYPPAHIEDTTPSDIGAIGVVLAGTLALSALTTKFVKYIAR